jgi:peptide/nickel transport system substrate-binding protein
MKKMKAKKIGALLLGSILVLSILVSCKGKSNAASSAAAPAAARLLQVSLEGSPDSLDPHVFNGSLSEWSTTPLHDFLIKNDKDLNFVPGIAQSWEFVSDTEIKFKLRENAYFHNGRKVTSADIKNTYERVLNPATASRYRSHIDCISSIEPNGDYEVTLKLSYPYSPLLARLTRIPIIPIEAVNTIATAPVGCGPFKFSEYESDQFIEMVKFDQYYDASKVSIEGIRFTFLPEYNAARTAFLAKDLDILLWADPNDVTSLNNQAGVTVVPTELLAIYYAAFDCTRAPFNNPKVRRAVYLALDRQQYVDSVLNGNAEILFSLMSGSSPYYNRAWTTQQNIAEAKKLLAEAGYPNGLSTVITTPNTPVEGPIGEILQSQLAAVGINAKLEKPDVATYLDQIFTRADFEIMICGTTGFGDPDDPAYTFLHQNGANYSTFKYQNKEVWDLLAKGRSVYDLAARKAFYDKAFQTIYEEAPIVPIMSETRYSAVHSNVSGFIARQNLTYDFSEIRISN